MSVGLLLNITGAALLLHSAYSCLHYRTLVSELDVMEEVNIPPLDVMLECVGGFFLLLITQLFFASGALVPVNKKKKQSLVAPAYKTRDFDIYANRAHVMKE